LEKRAICKHRAWQIFLFKNNPSSRGQFPSPGFCSPVLSGGCHGLCNQNSGVCCSYHIPPYGTFLRGLNLYLGRFSPTGGSSREGATASFWRVPSCRVSKPSLWAKFRVSKPSLWGEIKEAFMADVIQIADVKPMSVNDVKARIDIVKNSKR